MKRSEMVIKMARYYNIRQCMVEAKYITNMELWSEMLELIEDLGMYPPDRFLREDGGCYVSQWEPE